MRGGWHWGVPLDSDDVMYNTRTDNMEHYTWKPPVSFKIFKYDDLFFKSRFQTSPEEWPPKKELLVLDSWVFILLRPFIHLSLTRNLLNTTSVCVCVCVCVYGVFWMKLPVKTSHGKTLIIWKDLPFPIGSMYGIFTYIYYQNQPNVGKYTSPMDPKTMKHEGFVPPIYGWNKLWPLKMKGPWPWVPMVHGSAMGF